MCCYHAFQLGMMTGDNETRSNFISGLGFYHSLIDMCASGTYMHIQAHAGVCKYMCASLSTHRQENDENRGLFTWVSKVRLCFLGLKKGINNSDLMQLGRSLA